MANQSPLSQVTDQLEQIVALHGFSAITIGLNTKQAEGSRYDCALHFDDAVPGEIGCVHGYGPSIGKAVNEAYRRSVDVRLPSLPMLVAEAA